LVAAAPDAGRLSLLLLLLLLSVVVVVLLLLPVVCWMLTLGDGDRDARLGSA
jgi:hypothetical protein